MDALVVVQDHIFIMPSDQQLFAQMQPSRKQSVLKGYQFIQVNGIPCNLGFGAFGSVQLGRNLHNGQTVAIKKIGRKIAVNEVEVHMKLNHPNIIKMLEYAFDQKNESTYIVLEYAENGTLFDYIRGNGIKEKQIARDMFYGVCDAINYLHSKNIMHRDIKPENILLDRKHTVKLCDFGFAVNVQPRMTMCGTAEYMSPQMILRKPYNHKNDIWGLGILFFEMIEGKAPFQGQSQDQVLQRMKKPVQFSKKFTFDEIELIQRILKVNPNQRPEIKQIIMSPCFRKSQTSSEQMSKRSSTDEEVKPPSEKKIKIMEIKQLHADKPEKTMKIGSQKKSNMNIEITSVRDLNASQISQLNTSNMTTFKPEKIEKTIMATSLITVPVKQKISLKKSTKKA